jgi:hypothetical protein
LAPKILFNGEIFDNGFDDEVSFVEMLEVIVKITGEDIFDNAWTIEGGWVDLK